VSNKEVEQMLMRVRDLEEDKKLLKQEVEHLRDKQKETVKAQDLEEKNDRLRNENIGLRAHAEAADDECERLREAQLAAALRAQDLALENERLGLSQSTLLKELEEQGREVERLRFYLDQADPEYHKAELDRALAENERLQADYAAVKAAHDANAKMHGQAQAYYAKLQEAEAEVERLRKERDALRGMLPTSDYNELKAEVGRLRDERDEMADRIEGPGGYIDEVERLRALLRHEREYGFRGTDEFEEQVRQALWRRSDGWALRT